MNKIGKEIFIWVLILLPYAYLASIWNLLPEKVAIHFNINGEADGWSDKSMLLLKPGALGVGIYILMLVIPFLDPKKKIEQMGSKYYNLRLILAFFIAVLTTYLFYLSKEGSLQNPGILIAILGALFAMLGNYFQTVRPNYFVGIRTPWTLENEHVWKKTHQLGGKLWMAGGVLIVIVGFLLSGTPLLIAAGVVFLILVIVPISYSYLEFQKVKRDIAALNK